MITHAPMTRPSAALDHVAPASESSGFAAVGAADEDSGSGGGSAATATCGGFAVAAEGHAFAADDDVDFFV